MYAYDMYKCINMFNFKTTLMNAGNHFRKNIKGERSWYDVAMENLTENYIDW